MQYASLCIFVSTYQLRFFGFISWPSHSWRGVALSIAREPVLAVGSAVGIVFSVGTGCFSRPTWIVHTALLGLKPDAGEGGTAV